MVPYQPNLTSPLKGSLKRFSSPFSPRALRSSSLKVVVVVVVVVLVLVVVVVVVTFCKNLHNCLRSYRGRNLTVPVDLLALNKSL